MKIQAGASHAGGAAAGVLRAADSRCCAHSAAPLGNRCMQFCFQTGMPTTQRQISAEG